MVRVSIWMVAALVMAAGVSGCKSSESPIYFASPSSPYPDVPVPISFELVTQSAVGAGSAGVRNLDNVYQGKDALQPVGAFFREQMPRQGWGLVDQVQGGDQLALKFTKGAEVLRIEAWGTRNIRTNVRVQIMAAGATTQR